MGAQSHRVYGVLHAKIAWLPKTAQEPARVSGQALVPFFGFWRSIWVSGYRAFAAMAKEDITCHATLTSPGVQNKDGSTLTYPTTCIQFHIKKSKKSVFCHGQCTDFFCSTRKQPIFQFNPNTDLDIRLIVEPRCRSPPLLTF